MIGLADCFFTMVLVLAPMGGNSHFEGMQLKGTCASAEISSLINQFSELVVTTEWMRFVIPLPRREDRVRLSYLMESEYAYLGDCQFGLRPYFYPDSICQRVMVKFGPKRPM